MTQPKNVIFETGAPKIVASVTPDGVTYLPPDDWSTVLDLREDGDLDVVRRVTLYAHRNVNTDVPDPPEPLTSAFVVVIDDTITTGEDAITEGLVAACALPVSGIPVKIMDDFPMRGAVRMLVGAGAQSLDPIDNVVIFGFYTVAGSVGGRGMCDARPLQIGNAVPDLATQSVIATADPEDVHTPTEDYVDEITLISGLSNAPTKLIFQEATPDDPFAARYLYLDFSYLLFYSYNGIPVRDTGTIVLESVDGETPVGVTGFFSRY